MLTDKEIDAMLKRRQFLKVMVGGAVCIAALGGVVDRGNEIRIGTRGQILSAGTRWANRAPTLQERESGLVPARDQPGRFRDLYTGEFV